MSYSTGKTEYQEYGFSNRRIVFGITLPFVSCLHEENPLNYGEKNKLTYFN